MCVSDEGCFSSDVCMGRDGYGKDGRGNTYSSSRWAGWAGAVVLLGAVHIGLVWYVNSGQVNVVASTGMVDSDTISLYNTSST